MEYNFKDIDEISAKINNLELQRIELMKIGGSGINRAEVIAKEINKLKLIKYDMLNGTHTYELYELKNKLKNAIFRFNLADVRNKKHYALQIKYYENEIKRIEENDMCVTKLLKK